MVYSVLNAKGLTTIYAVADPNEGGEEGGNQGSNGSGTVETPTTPDIIVIPDSGDQTN